MAAAEGKACGRQNSTEREGQKGCPRLPEGRRCRGVASESANSTIRSDATMGPPERSQRHLRAKIVGERALEDEVGHGDILDGEAE